MHQQTGAAAPAHGRADGGDFSGQFLDGVNLADRLLSHIRFDGASLKRANFTRAEFRDCSFKGAMLDCAKMHRTTFENCDFSRATVTNANFREAVFRATTILGYGRESTFVRQAKTNFDGATLDGSSFAGARMVAACLHNVRATHVDFTNCDLRNASFDGSKLKGVSFGGANLLEANFAKCPDARSYLPDYALLIAKLIQPISPNKLESYLKSHQQWLDTDGAEGTRLNLQGYDLSGQKFENLDFSGTDFRGARLDKALFIKVMLVSADLRDASMLGTSFRSSDIRGALLTANALRRATLQDTLSDVPKAPPAQH